MTMKVLPVQTLEKAAAAIDRATADHAAKLGLSLDSPPPPAQKPEPSLVRSSGMAPIRDIEWLWPGYIPYGMISILSADGGEGKSTAAGLIAATLSVGKPLPGQTGERAPISTLWISDEEDEGEIRQHIEKAGGNPALVDNVDERRSVSVDLDQHWDVFKKCVDDACGARLIVLDPISAFCGRVNFNDQAQIRPLLSRLSAFARDRNIAILVLSHNNKKSQEVKAVAAVAGSNAIVNRSRSVLLLARDGTDPDTRVIIQGKTNKGREATSVAFRISDTSVEWAGFRPEITSMTLEKAAQRHMSVKQYLAQEDEKNRINEALADVLEVIATDEWRRWPYSELMRKYGPSIYGDVKPKIALDRLLSTMRNRGIEIITYDKPLKINGRTDRGFTIRKIPTSDQIEQTEF